MRLAWRNLLHDRTRFAVTIVGVAFAVSLMILEGSLLCGFMEASSKVINATDVDLWITARGVPCFDFPAPLPERFRSLALGVEGVEKVYRLATGFAVWQKADGVRQTVIVVGADSDIGSAFPRPTLTGGNDTAPPESVLVDHSELSSLGLDRLPSSVEIARRRARVSGAASGFGSFLGSPYVFASYADAFDYAGLRPEETTFLLCRVAPGHDIEGVRQSLRSRLPEADVWTRAEFSSRARAYWVLQTGAGGALLTAGVLGFIVGVVIVSQTIYATTMENIEEFATLKAMGAPRGYLRRLVMVQALVAALVGCGVGLAVSLPLVGLLGGVISWIRTPAWLPVLMLAVSLGMCALASLASIQKAATVEPARVFRA